MLAIADVATCALTLHLGDLGLDTIKAIAAAMYEEFNEPLYTPAPFLLRTVGAGRLGRTSG
jgi:3-hydroxybutyryl-CoA dehydrogenase